jgi:hypothetical protein
MNLNTVTTWTVSPNGSNHTVQCIHWPVTEKWEIWIDGVCIRHGKNFLSPILRNQISVAGVDFELITVCTLPWGYFLLLNGMPVLSKKDIQRGRTVKDLFRSRFLRELPFWHDLAAMLDLNYYADRNGSFTFRHRLVGMIDGYLVTLVYRVYDNNNRSAWILFVHHAQPLFPETLKSIETDSRVLEIRGKFKKLKSLLGSDSYGTCVALPAQKREKPEQLARRIRTFVNVISEITDPFPSEICENPDCQHKAIPASTLVLVNGLPRRLCPDCLGAIPKWGEMNRQAYQAAPSNFLPGLVVGVGAAMLGALGWAALEVLFQRIASLFAGFAFIMIVKAMAKVQAKRSVPNLIAAAVLTVLSVTLGNWATALFVLLRAGVPLSWAALGDAWRLLLAQPSMLILSYFFILLTAGFYLWNLILHHKAALAQLFKPEVEVIPGRY